MDLNQWSDDLLTRLVAGGGVVAVVSAWAWKKIMEAREDKRGDGAGQLAQQSFANIIKGQIEEIARMRELILTLRAENKAQAEELLKEIRNRYDLERQLGETRRLAQSASVAAKVATDASAEVEHLAEGVVATTDAGAVPSLLAKNLLLDKIVQLEDELREKNKKP